MKYKFSKRNRIEGTVRLMGPFGNIVLVTLFKCCGNMCGYKCVMEIHIVLFKQRKLLFKQHNQIAP